eukprot:403366258
MLLNYTSAQYYKKCTDYKTGEKNSLGMDLFKIPAGQTCEINLSTPNTGSRSMKTLSNYTDPIQANRLDCPPGINQCTSFLVDSQMIYNYKGIGQLQYYSTYFFSNLAYQSNQFAFSVAYDGDFETSNAMKLFGNLSVITIALVSALFFMI